MTLLLTMLPFYFLGNLHCLGMCGPIAFFLSRHPYRFWYLGGRIASFTLAATIAALFGRLIALEAAPWGLGGTFSILIGLCLITTALGMALFQAVTDKITPVSRFLEKLTIRWALSEKPLPLFGFGFSSVLLPCGQSLFVFAACALSQDGWVGLINGLAFSLITTPALLLPMQAAGWIKRGTALKIDPFKGVGLCVGLLFLCRGLADWGWISHQSVSFGTTQIILW